LDQLGFDVAELCQLTHDDLIAKQTVADAKATNMATSACYITTCLHAEKVARSLEHATISLNLRQGQANSPDLADFATEVVHDPADSTYLGGAYIMDCTPSECHLSLNTTHGVGIGGKTPYTCNLSPSVPPPPSALKPPPSGHRHETRKHLSFDKLHGEGIKCGTTYFYKQPRVVPKPIIQQCRIAQSKKDKAHNKDIKAFAILQGEH
jgi:hypothetical protein